MEISKIKIAGHPVDVLFTGSQYIFNSGFFGVVCVANRTSYDNPEFEIIAGNSQCLGGSLTESTAFAAAKKFITRSENRYIKQNVKYTEKSEDLNKWSINIEARPR